MNKEFVPYEEALALKQLGFDEPCLAYWYNETPTNPEGQCLVYYKKPWDEQKIINGIIRDYYVAPTFSQAFRWFREKHKLHCHIEYIPAGDVYEWWIKYDRANYPTYEEAELACLRKLIEIVRKKQ